MLNELLLLYNRIKKFIKMKYRPLYERLFLIKYTIRRHQKSILITIIGLFFIYLFSTLIFESLQNIRFYEIKRLNLRVLVKMELISDKTVTVINQTLFADVLKPDFTINTNLHWYNFGDCRLNKQTVLKDFIKIENSLKSEGVNLQGINLRTFDGIRKKK